MTRLHRSVLGLALVALTGCYSYTLAPVESVSPGTGVRARVTPAEAARLARILGRENRVLSGEFVGEEDGGLLLQVGSVADPATGRLFQRVTIPRAELVELEIRRLDRWKTAGVAGAVAAAVIYASLQAFGDESEAGGREPGGVDAVGIPLRWFIK